MSADVVRAHSGDAGSDPSSDSYGGDAGIDPSSDSYSLDVGSVPSSDSYSLDAGSVRSSDPYSGDTGSDSSSDHIRTATSCESAILTKIKSSGVDIEKDLDDRRRKNEKPLEIMFCPRTYNVIGAEHAAFVCLVDTQIKTKVPGHFDSWKSVPQQYKDQVFDMIKWYYQIEGRNDFSKCIDGIDREMKVRYLRRKTTRHKHFEKYYKGPEDWDKVLDNPTTDVNKEEWKQICRLFTSPKFIARSVKKKEDRRKQIYISTWGTNSLMSTHKRAKYHRRIATTDFVKKDARQNYKKLKADVGLQTQQTPDCASIDGSSTTVNQAVVLHKKLGKNRGRKQGASCELKGSGSTSTEYSPFTESQTHPRHLSEQERVENLMNKVKNLTDQVNYLVQFLPHPYRPPNIQMSHMPDSNNMSGALPSQPLPLAYPSMYGAMPSQPMAPPYMYGAMPLPYPWPIPPSSQPPYPYMCGAGSSTLPSQYPWPMPPLQPPQQPQFQPEDYKGPYN